MNDRTCSSHSFQAGRTEGVDGKVSVPQSPTNPPGSSKCGHHEGEKKIKSKYVLRKTGKRSRLPKKRNQQKNDTLAGKKSGGSRLIRPKNIFLELSHGRTDKRTCLLQAILSLIATSSIKESLQASMLSQGDSSIERANVCLQNHNLVLRRVTKRYNLGGSMVFHLFQEQSCSLIIHLKLVDKKDKTLVALHFVAWDGRIIHEHPKSARVNLSTDRTREHCKDVFHRLYHKSHYSSWQITNVYSLEQLNCC